MVLQQQQLMHILHVYKQPSQQRTDKDIWFLRDRLHECSSFFRLWPSQLQQLLCRLTQVRQWVQQEILAAADCKPEELCFILDGQAAVAVRASPGSSLLRDVALLHAGDSFGELCLLGKQRHPAFVVVRSPVLTTVSVKAQELAEAMAAMQQQAAGGIPASTQGSEAQGNGTCSSNNSGSSSCQQPIAATSQGGSISVDALYQLIGQPCGPPKANLKPGQAQQVKQLYSRQLQEAAAAEAATVGAWQQLPHERLLLGSLTVQEQPEQGRRSLQPDDAQGPQAHKQRQQQKPSAAGALGHGMATSSLQDNCTLTSDQPAAGDSFVSEGAHGTAAAGAGSDGCSAAAGSANAGQGRPPQAAQEEHVHPSPLMHHAAIMQVAARRAAGQAVL